MGATTPQKSIRTQATGPGSSTKKTGNKKNATTSRTTTATRTRRNARDDSESQDGDDEDDSDHGELVKVKMDLDEEKPKPAIKREAGYDDSGSSDDNNGGDSFDNTPTKKRTLENSIIDYTTGGDTKVVPGAIKINDAMRSYFNQLDGTGEAA